MQLCQFPSFTPRHWTLSRQNAGRCHGMCGCRGRGGVFAGFAVFVRSPYPPWSFWPPCSGVFCSVWRILQGNAFSALRPTTSPQSLRSLGRLLPNHSTPSTFCRMWPAMPARCLRSLLPSMAPRPSTSAEKNSPGAFLRRESCVGTLGVRPVFPSRGDQFDVVVVHDRVDLCSIAASHTQLAVARPGT